MMIVGFLKTQKKMMGLMSWRGIEMCYKGEETNVDVMGRMMKGIGIFLMKIGMAVIMATITVYVCLKHYTFDTSAILASMVYLFFMLYTRD